MQFWPPVGSKKQGADSDWRIYLLRKMTVVDPNGMYNRFASASQLVPGDLSVYVSRTLPLDSPDAKIRVDVYQRKPDEQYSRKRLLRRDVPGPMDGDHLAALLAECYEYGRAMIAVMEVAQLEG